MTAEPTPIAPGESQSADAPFPAALKTDNGWRWRGPAVCSIAGISYRQLDYWCRVGYLEPEGEGQGSGSQRLFAEAEIRRLRLVNGILLALETNPRHAFDLARRLDADDVVELPGGFMLGRVS